MIDKIYVLGTSDKNGWLTKIDPENYPYRWQPHRSPFERLMQGFNKTISVEYKTDRTKPF